MAIGKLSRFENIFSNTIIDRGVDYENMGRVIQLSKNNINTHGFKTKQYVANVIGTHNYQVKLLLTDLPDNDKVIESITCQCPYEDYCKHMVAVLVHLRKIILSGEEQDISIREVSIQTIDDIKAVDPIRTTRHIDIDDLISSLSTESLQAFIKQSLSSYPSLIDDLTIWLHQQKATGFDHSAHSILSSSSNNTIAEASDKTKPQSAPKDTTLKTTTPKIIVDTVLVQSLKQKIDTLLDVNFEHMDWYGPDFSEQLYQLNVLLVQFDNQPYYQLVMLTQWIDKLCVIWDESPEMDLSEPLDEGFRKIGEIAFKKSDSQPPNWYSPFWSNEFRLYLTELDGDSTAMLHEKAELWHYNTDLDEMCDSFKVERLAFDLFIAQKDWQQALNLLDKNIKINKTQPYGEFELPDLIQLKIMFYEYLRDINYENDINDKILKKMLTDKNSFNNAIQSLLDEYDYLPDIRQIKIQKAIEADDLETAIKHINKGVSLAEKNNQTGIVHRLEKQLNDLLEQQLKATMDDTSVHQSVIEKLRKTNEKLAFNSYNIDKKYYKQWQKTYSNEQWKQVILAKQKELQEAIADNPPNIHKSHFVTAFNWTEFSQLAQTYVLENQPLELVALIKAYPNRKYVDRYQAQIADVDRDWLIDFYSQDWQQKIEQVSVRKHYHELAQDIQKLLETLPQGKSRWRDMVDGWQVRFSQSPRKPALLDELSKIDWTIT